MAMQRSARLEIRQGDLSDPRIADFLEAHMRDMRAVSPPESKHALDLDGLRRPEIDFWSMWQGLELVGCGALKRLDEDHAELKSMRIASVMRRRGAATCLLEFIFAEARRMGFDRMSLETGAMPFFAPARALYERHGFTSCPPFADYRSDPNSVFMTRSL